MARLRHRLSEPERERSGGEAYRAAAPSTREISTLTFGSMPVFASAPPPAASKASILAVDDHPANLVALDAVLAELGHRVVPATSASDALRLLAREDFALVLLDVHMPGTDGFETAAL